MMTSIANNSVALWIRARLAWVLGLVCALGMVCNPFEARAAWCKVQTHAHDFTDDANWMRLAKLERYRLAGFTAVVDTNHFGDRARECYTYSHDGGTLDASVAALRGLDVVEVGDLGNGLYVCDPSFDDAKRYMEGPRDGGFFFVIPGQEVTASGPRAVHQVAIGNASALTPKDASTLAVAWDANVRMIRDAAVAAEAGISTVLPEGAHVNWNDAGTREILGVDLWALEIWSGHQHTAPNGFGTHQPSARKTADLVNRDRAALGLGPVFLTAVDDAHDYNGTGPRQPFRGWVNVWCDATPSEAEILHEMETGNFHASSGHAFTTIVLSFANVSAEATGMIRVLGLLRGSGERRTLAETRDAISVDVPCALGDFWGVRVEARNADGQWAWSQPMGCP